MGFDRTDPLMAGGAKLSLKQNDLQRIGVRLGSQSKGGLQIIYCTYTYVYMGVSENGGTPKSSSLIGFSIIKHPFWGTPIFGNTHIDTCAKEIERVDRWNMEMTCSDNKTTLVSYSLLQYMVEIH